MFRPMQPCKPQKCRSSDERPCRQRQRADGSCLPKCQYVTCNSASGLVSGGSSLACRPAIRSSRLGSSGSSSVDTEDERSGLSLVDDLRHDRRVTSSSRSSSGLWSRLPLCVVGSGTRLDTFDHAAVAVLDVSDYSQPQSRGLVSKHRADGHERHRESLCTDMVFTSRVKTTKRLTGKGLLPTGHLAFRTINERLASMYTIPLSGCAAVRQSSFWLGSPGRGARHVSRTPARALCMYSA